jgi:thioredoxin 1
MYEKGMEEINSKQFQEILKKEKLIVLDCYADWCMPCKIFAPILEKVSKDYADIKFFKMNVDANSEFAEKLGIMSIPTVIMFKDGKEVDRIIGLISEQQLRAWIDKQKKR